MDKRSRKIYVLWGIALTLLVSVGALCWVVAAAGCQHGFAPAVQPLAEKFPAYWWNEVIKYSLPKKGETYRLTMKVAPKAKKPPKAMWVHRVTREVPGPTLEELTTLARSLGFKKTLEWHKLGGVVLKEGNARLFTDRRRVEYFTPDYEQAYQVNSIKDFKALNKDLDKEAMFRIGMRRIQELDLWPEKVASQYSSSTALQHTFGDGQKVILSRRYYCRGVLEDTKVIGDNYYLCFSTTCAGKLGTLELAWKQSERHAFLKCKTIEEAFADLNNGYATPLTESVKGGTATYLGYDYYPEPHGTKFIHPVYTFQVKRGKTTDEVVVPAVRAEYFIDPERQVVLTNMLKKPEKQ